MTSHDVTPDIVTSLGRYVIPLCQYALIIIMGWWIEPRYGVGDKGHLLSPPPNGNHGNQRLRGHTLQGVVRDGNGVDLVHISDEIRVNSVNCLLTSELTIVTLR